MVTDTKQRQLGKRIRKLRLQKGLSQEALAEPAYSAAYISHVEHGKRRPSQETLTHIARKLDVTLEQLLTGRDPHDDLRLEIEIQGAIAQIHAGDAKAARKRLEEARREAEGLAYGRALLRADEGLGLALLRMGETDRALGVFTRAEEVASAMIVEERTPFRVGRARCLFQLGDFSGALHLLESHLAGLRASEGADPTAFLQVYAALIPPYFAAGYLERARDVASKGLELASRVPDPEQRACFYVNRAGLLLTQGEPRDALASLALAEDLFRQLGWHAETVKVGLMRAMAFIEQDDLAVAEGVLREVLDNGGDAMTKSDRVQALNHLAHVRRRSGHPEEAVTLTSASIKLAGTKFPNLVAEAYREAGLAHVAAGEQDKAVTLWRRALKLYQKLGNHEDIAKTARLIGDLLMESGRTQEAVDIYRSGLGSMGDLR